MNAPSRPDTKTRKNSAFHEAATAIHEQFDGSQPGDHESVAYVCQKLCFLMLTNGDRLDLENSLRNLEIFHERLLRQISASQSTKAKRTMQ